MEAASLPAAPGPVERRVVGAIVRRWFGGRRIPLPEVPFDLHFEPVSFPGNVGARISGRWFPHAQPEGTVILVHPDKRLAQHWFVRTGWVRFLLGAGFNVLTFDLAIYGHSRGGSTYFHEDVIAAAEEARRHAPGLPLHIIGLSNGAYAAINASPHLRGVESLVLESPFPRFNEWYGRGAGKWAMDVMNRLFPRTARAIDAGRNIADAVPRRILVVAAGADAITRPALSRAVFEAAPSGRAAFLELDGLGHLEGFESSPAYRAAILDTLGVSRVRVPVEVAPRRQRLGTVRAGPARHHEEAQRAERKHERVQERVAREPMV